MPWLLPMQGSEYLKPFNAKPLRGFFYFVVKVLLSLKLIQSESMQIFKNLEEHVEHIALVLLVTVLSMIAYFLTSPQPPRERTKSAFAGGVIAGVLSYPTWALIGSLTPSGHLHVGWLTVIIFIYSVSGQFIPEFLQSVIPKLAKKLFNRSYKAKTGEDFEDDH